MAISKLTSPVTQNDAINKINEVIDNIGSGGTSPSPSSSTPLMDGTAAVGTSTDYARGDHRHPSDTTKADAEQVDDLEARFDTLESSAVTNVAWDTTNHKLTKTINGTTSDISILPGLLNRGTITAFNNATTTGLYTYASSATNRPPVSAGGACLVLYISSSSCWQLAFITSTSSTAMQAYARRMYSSGNWTSWKAFTFSS